MLFQSKHPWVFRQTSIPWTGKRRRYRGRYFRHPRTTQERRYSVDPTYKKFIRGRRAFHNIPNSYDDIMKPSFKNWKRYRKTKYWRIANI